MVKRVLTALVGIPVLVLAIWYGPPWLTLLVVLASLLGIRELYRLRPSSSERLPLGLGALWVVAFVLAAVAAATLEAFLAASAGIFLGGAFLAVLWLIAFHRGRNIWASSAYLVAGPVYVGFLLAHALTLRELEGSPDAGRGWLLFALLATFATDTGAFFTGRAVGKRPLAPGISPGKTWEGAAGGFLLAVAAAVGLHPLLGLTLPLWQTAIIGATVGVVSQCGDLLESKLKRLSSVKDAGSIIPGHGGILDRLDSILVSIPAVYYLLSTVFQP